MLAGDTEGAASHAATMFRDARVHQFYDPRRRAGHTIAHGRGWEGHIAWDIYLFYAQDALWGNEAPRPVTYLHQLRETWATPERRRRGPILFEALRDTLHQLITSIH